MSQTQAPVIPSVDDECAPLRDVSEQRFRTLADSAPVGIYRTDADGQTVYSNNRWYEIAGLDPELDRGRGWIAALHPDDRQRVMRQWQEALRAGEVFEAEYRFLRPTGEEAWVVGRAVPERDSLGRVCGYVGTVTDITDRKQSEQAIAASKAMYEGLVNTIDGIVWEVDASTFQFTFVSDKAQRLLGYPVERWTSEPNFWREHVHPDDIQSAMNFCVAATAELRDHEFEYRMIAADGRIVWLRDIVSVIAENGRARKLRGVMVDVTAQREAERARHESEERLRTVVTAAPLVIWATDARGVITLSEGTALAPLGFKPGELVGRNVFDMYRDHPQIISNLKRTLSGETVTDTVEVGGVVIESRCIPLRDAKGQIVGMTGVGIDVTQRRRSEDALRLSESRYRSLFSSNPDPTWVYDLQTLRFLAFNDAAMMRYGYSAQDFGAMTVLDIRPPEDVPAALAAIDDHKRRGLTEGGIWRHRCKNGSIVDAETASHNIEFDGRPARIVVARDITERLKTSRALRESEERYRRLVENVRLIAWEYDRAAKQFTFVSPQAQDILGYPLSAWSTPAFWYDHLHPDDRESAVKFSHDHIARGEDHEFEYRMIKADGGVAWLRDLTSMVWENGQVTRLHGVFVDVTERKQTEEAVRRSGDLLRLLLSELDHRVRNNLASLSALIDISARSQTSVTEFARSIQGRLLAMATVHGLLSRGHWRTVSLRDLAQSIVPEDLRPVVSIDGPEIMLVPQQVTAMGMILQELTANSLKYGALGSRAETAGGRVNLTWTQTGPESADSVTLQMTWQETGGPALSAVIEARVGSALIMGLVRSELRGAVELAYPPQGALHQFTMQIDRPK